MKQEDIKLLLRDLSARLPYGVKCVISEDYHYYERNKGISPVDCEVVLNGMYLHSFINNSVLVTALIVDIKPYLRLMSSMTEEEREEFRSVGGVMSHNLQNDSWAISAFTPEAYDWLNRHHFDYRGLIPMGLALEATEGMY